MADPEKLLSPVLEKVVKEQDYKNYKTEVKLISSGGANYTSALFEIKVFAPEKDDINLFAKVAIMGEQIRSMTTMQIYEVEMLFYTKIISKYREMEERYNFPAEDRLILPKYYGGSVEYMQETLLLEDLTCKGYQPFDRFKCFDWEYASKCVSVLAKLHALSIGYERDNPEEYTDMIKKLSINLSSNDMKAYTEKLAANAIEATADEYKGKLQKYVDDNFNDETFAKFFNPTRAVTLNHGDFRPSNVLHKTKVDGSLEVVLIDFQALQKNNPVSDLLYFLISGSDEEFRRKYFNQFFDFYYEEFSRILRMLEIDPLEVYTKEDFDKDVKEILSFGVMLAIAILPIVTVEEQNAPKLEDGIDLDNFIMETSALFKTRFNGVIKDFVNLGLL